MISKQTQTQETYLRLLSLGIGITLGNVAAAVIILLLFEVITQTNLSAIASGLSPWLPGQGYEILQRAANTMGFPLQQETAAFWYMSRASALLAYLLLWGSTIWGLLLSTKIIKKSISRPLIFSLHEFLSLLGLGFAVFHGLILLGDRYIDFKLWHILVPFSAPYEPFWVGVGVLSLYLYALLVISFYIRRQIGQKIWRALHYLTFALFGMTLVHSLAIGSDTGFGGIRLVYLISAAIFFFLLCYRILSGGKTDALASVGE